jgi:FAD/FMN-containing dehydrogenase/Fe-S oxidoreductase
MPELAERFEEAEAPKMAALMDADAAMLSSELEAATGAEVRFSAGDRRLYAYDASVFRQVPIGVVVPRSVDDVIASVEVCRHHRVPVLPRGCGTSLAGQCCNVAVVIDFSKYLNNILDVDPSRQVARVQPGVICDQLRDAAQEHGLTFGPDPATHDHCTLGGMIGNNSCGTHSVMAGKTVDNVLALEVLLYDGTRLRIGTGEENALDDIIGAGGRRGDVYAGLRELRDRYGDLIRERFPDIPRRVSGYNLDDLLPEKGFNPARAFVGTEGTCGLVLEAEVRLVPSPPKRTLVVLGYRSIPASGRDVAEIMAHQPIGLEFTSRHVLTNLDAKGFDFGGRDLLPEGDAWLLTEFGGDTQEEADAKASGLARALQHRAEPAVKVYDQPDEENAVWEIRRHSAGTARMPKMMGDHGGWPNWEDAAVPPDRLGDYLDDYLALLREHNYDGVFYGHWGQGCIHCRIDFDLRSPTGIGKYRRFMEQAADLVISYGGSLSGEHGDGHGRAELLPKMFGPELIRAFEQFKTIWDPDNGMNPGKIVHPYRLDEHLREGPEFEPPQLRTHFALLEDAGSFAEAAGRCFGVGKCRHVEGGTMCPSFMVTREEEHSTRGRARLLYEMATRPTKLDNPWRDEKVKEALDLCLACKGCKGDCPVKVDMATYKAEFLSHYYDGRLRPRAAYAMGLIPIWARLAERAPQLVNAISSAPGLAGLVKWAGGVDQRRAVPRFAAQTFRQWFEARPPSPTDRSARVLLWPDTFNNHFLPGTAQAATSVLEAAGFAVAIPRRRLCCGRPFYDYGMLDKARRYLGKILDSLREEIRSGTPIVVLEPSCAAVFRDEMINLMPHDEDAQRLAKQTLTLAEFLQQRAPHWQPPHLAAKAMAQVHCHQSAVLGFDAERDLFARMGVDLEVPDTGCCGMAGSFGYEAGERCDVSLKAGERALLPKVRDAAEDTLIIADGFSCREQIEQGTSRRALHLAEAIRLAMHVAHDPRFSLDHPEQRAAELIGSQPEGPRRAARAVGAGMATATTAATAAAWRYRHRAST